MKKHSAVKILICFAIVLIVAFNAHVVINCAGKVVRGLYSMECLNADD